MNSERSAVTRKLAGFGTYLGGQSFRETIRDALDLSRSRTDEVESDWLVRSSFRNRQAQLTDDLLITRAGVSLKVRPLSSPIRDSISKRRPRLIPTRTIDALIRYYRTCFVYRLDLITKNLASAALLHGEPRGDFTTACERILIPAMVREATRSSARVLHSAAAPYLFGAALIVALALPDPWASRLLAAGSYIMTHIIINLIAKLVSKARFGPQGRHRRDLTWIFALGAAGTVIVVTKLATSPLALGAGIALIAGAVYRAYSYVVAVYAASNHLHDRGAESESYALWTLINARHALADHHDANLASRALLECAKAIRTHLRWRAKTEPNPSRRQFLFDLAEAVSGSIAWHAQSLTLNHSARFTRVVKLHVDAALSNIARGRWGELAWGHKRALIEPIPRRGRRVVNLSVRLMVSLGAIWMANNPGWLQVLRVEPLYVFGGLLVVLSVLDFYTDGSASAGLSPAVDLTSLHEH